jgi:endonuclease/exonuclease/phosphatase family metal-dependent hydrolase
MRILILALPLLLAACQSVPSMKHAEASVRFATYNTSLNDDQAGGLIAKLQKGDDNAKRVAAVIQREHPDVLLLNEFDYDDGHVAADLFQHRYLEVGQFGQAPIKYPYRYLGPVNTGVPSGMDLDHDGKIGGDNRGAGNDAFGFGLHPGQYGMLVLSRYPIDVEKMRSFQKFLWKDLPGALAPIDPKTGAAWYPPEVWANFRLSSKSHWDLPIQTPLGVIHFLVDHPTPPVFDGPEDRNGRRNHDEIRLWAEYISGGDKPWLCDDRGVCGGLASDARFVIAGDHNADPIDGDSTADAIHQLLDHPRVLHYPAPESEGAVIAAQTVGQGNLGQKGNPAQDTGDFGPKVGNLRLDYVLPSVGLSVRDSGVFWPKPGDTGADWIDASDHHLVWLDLTR